MATEQTPPRSQLITLYGVLSILVLVALKFVFDSYYIGMSEKEIYSKVLAHPATELSKYRAEQLKQLHSGEMPIDRAKGLLVEQGRGSLAAIAPTPSDDQRALQGWTHFPGGRVPESVVRITSLETIATDEAQPQQPPLDAITEAEEGPIVTQPTEDAKQRSAARGNDTATRPQTLQPKGAEPLGDREDPDRNPRRITPDPQADHEPGDAPRVMQPLPNKPPGMPEEGDE